LKVSPRVKNDAPSFAFEGVWICTHGDGWKGTRTVMRDKVVDFDGADCRWVKEDGQIIVTWPDAGHSWERLDLDSRNPDRLTGTIGRGDWRHAVPTSTVVWDRKKAAAGDLPDLSGAQAMDISSGATPMPASLLADDPKFEDSVEYGGQR